jgi:hypothetical protein
LPPLPAPADNAAMEAELIKADNAATNGWDEIELSRDRPSARAFWSSVFSFAIAGHATAIVYWPALGEDCLRCEVDGRQVFMIPPPAELRSWLLKEGRRLAGLTRTQSAKRAAKKLLRLKLLPGKIYISAGGTFTEWTPHRIADGLRFVCTADSHL